MLLLFKAVYYRSAAYTHTHTQSQHINTCACTYGLLIEYRGKVI